MRHLKRDWRKAALSDRHRAMLAYAEKLTVNPSGVQRSDMEALLAAGFTEREYYDITLIAAFFHLVTRIADGFGIALDPAYHEKLAEMGEEPVFSPKESDNRV